RWNSLTPSTRLNGSFGRSGVSMRTASPAGSVLVAAPCTCCACAFCLVGVCGGGAVCPACSCCRARALRPTTTPLNEASCPKKPLRLLPILVSSKRLNFDFVSSTVGYRTNRHSPSAHPARRRGGSLTSRFLEREFADL